MLSVTIVGHLGADAEIKSKDGREFMTFRVAHSNRYEKNGQKVEETQWINCLMHGDGGKLKEYLTKGQMVCVIGDASANIVSSPKLRRMVVGIDVVVRSVELLGGSAGRDAVPRQLATSDGVLHDVYKFYSVRPEVAQQYQDAAGLFLMFDRNGQAYEVKNAWIKPSSEQASAEDAAGQEPAPETENN